MSPHNTALLILTLGSVCFLIYRIADRKIRERAEFEAKLSRLFNEVRSDSATRHRFDRMIPKDATKL